MVNGQDKSDNGLSYEDVVPSVDRVNLNSHNCYLFGTWKPDACFGRKPSKILTVRHGTTSDRDD